MFPGLLLNLNPGSTVTWSRSRCRAGWGACAGGALAGASFNFISKNGMPASREGSLLGGVGVFTSLHRALQLVVKQQGGFWGAVELENGIPVRGEVGVRVAMATRLCLTDASCKSVWKREGPFVFGRVEWASLNPRWGKRALERVGEGDGMGRPRGGSAEAVPLARGWKLGRLEGAVVNN